ncbi:MAG TPA: ammonium transporter [Thermomicrobiales bacterium]|nr:ammonium transporter [Thermomicrobiales bacterium]
MIDAGNTAWVLTSAALVMLMTPALGFFYGGLVSRKNVLSTIMHSFFILALISVVWVLWGYTLVFGPDKGGIIGGLDHIGLRGIAPTDVWEPYGIPTYAFISFQMMFAAITPALITGAFAERKRFKAFVVFSILWSTFVYAPLAHWVWGGGWMFELGAIDFAGGIVIHVASGVAALVAAIVLGKRRTFGTPQTDPHDLTMTVLGAGLLWFGWFGFNAGSALGATGQAATAFLVTNVAAAMGALTWLSVSWIRHGHPSVLGAAAGAVAGLVGITPAAGFVGPMAAIIIGFGAGLFCCLALEFVKGKLHVDDALDVFAVHGIGGIWGAIATGLFAQDIYSGGEGVGYNGAFFGNPELLWNQVVATAAAVVFSAAMTFIILKVVNLIVPLRVEEDAEVLGLDSSQHGEVAYQL